MLRRLAIVHEPRALHSARGAFVRVSPHRLALLWEGGGEGGGGGGGGRVEGGGTNKQASKQTNKEIYREKEIKESKGDSLPHSARGSFVRVSPHRLALFWEGVCVWRGG